MVDAVDDRGVDYGMKFRLVVEYDSQTKRWAAFFPELPGCASAGDAEQEAITNAKEALELWFKPCPGRSRSL
jgi:predicted RNase H-like HicB family nuclease